MSALWLSLAFSFVAHYLPAVVGQKPLHAGALASPAHAAQQYV